MLELQHEPGQPEDLFYIVYVSSFLFFSPYRGYFWSCLLSLELMLTYWGCVWRSIQRLRL